MTGLDLTPELLAIARAQAPDITWVEGDAQDLPFADASFDAVLSVFGCMFAPDHQRTAREILRVLRPGGRAVIASWTPEGEAARLLRLVGRHLPPPPGDPPVLWGDEEHVRTLFPARAASARSSTSASRRPTTRRSSTWRTSDRW